MHQERFHLISLSLKVLQVRRPNSFSHSTLPYSLVGMPNLLILFMHRTIVKTKHCSFDPAAISQTSMSSRRAVTSSISLPTYYVSTILPLHRLAASILIQPMPQSNQSGGLLRLRITDKVTGQDVDAITLDSKQLTRPTLV
jgi:hypothetical protein